MTEIHVPANVARVERTLNELLYDMRRSGAPIAWRRHVEELIGLLPHIEKVLK